MPKHIKWLVEDRIEIARIAGELKIHFVGKHIEKDMEIYDQWKEEAPELCKWMEEDLGAVIEGRCDQIISYLRAFF